ncbi:hypothetical protein [Rothia nasimurium]|uniref:hypothetical protein n=1 Tax=Rothia nasimurium TaxID=85336 RepID=UPI001F3EA04D|nr:hypothetical protein [Rothia nasimurium]
MTFEEAIYQLMGEDALVKIKIDDYEKTEVELLEPQDADSRIKIRNLPQDAIVINADMFPSPKGFFRNTRSECKRADFIIIYPTKKLVIFIELKKGKKEKEFLTNQLKGAESVADYICSILENFWGKQFSFKDFDKLFYAFIDVNVKKTQTRYKGRDSRKSQNTTADNFEKLYGCRTIQFDRLVKNI